MRIVTFLNNSWLIIKDHLERSFSFRTPLIYYSLEQLSQVPALSKRLVIVIGSDLDIGVSLTVSHLEMIGPLIRALLAEGQRGLVVVIDTSHIACSYELICSLGDPKISLMRKRELRKLRNQLSYLSSAFEIPVFFMQKER